MSTDLARDVEMVRSIPAIPSILEVVCLTTGMGFAAVARVTEARWIACEVLDNVHFGLQPGGELAVESTLCHEVRSSREEIVFDHAANDPLYANHHTPRIYGLQSYISVPIILPDGSFFGTLCAIDAKPAKLKNPAVLGMFRLFAELIAFHIDAHDKLTTSRAEMASQRHASELREQFIAVLGHDLRNPLASIASGASLLLREPQSERSLGILKLVQGSVSRMSLLIDNVLDFARGRLGSGIEVQPTGTQLQPTLEQVLSEARSANPDRAIEADIDLDRVLAANSGRIGQLFSNLLGNAIAHGDPATPIRVVAGIVGDHLELAVSNGGQVIEDTTMGQLFEPFSRGKDSRGREGLGLGLYIAAQIAKAHGGTIEVTSDAALTRFTFRMPATGAVV